MAVLATAIPIKIISRFAQNVNIKGRDFIGKNKITPQDRYNKEKTRMYTFRVIENTEMDIIEKLDSTPNKSRYIKNLIRKDIAETK